MKRWWLAGCVLLGAGQAHGACNAVVTTAAGFGSLNSTQVRTTSQPASTINGGLSCTGSLLSLLTNNDHFWLTVTSPQSGLVGPTGDVIGYTLYANNSTSYPVARGLAYDFARNGIIDALGLLGGTVPKTVPLYLGTLVGSNVAAGVYKETLTLFWNWNYCSGIGVGGICLGRDINSGTVTLDVSLTVTNDCQITTPTINFGGAPVVSGFATVNQSVNLSCTKGSSYTVGLNDGENVSGGRRRMKSAAGGFLAYDIFKSGGSVRWGSLTTARRASADADINPGNGTGTGSQIFNYNAKVYTDQATPAAGSYLDNVILDVQF